AVCYGGNVAELAERGLDQPAGAVGVGASGRAQDQGAAPSAVAGRRPGPAAHRGGAGARAGGGSLASRGRWSKGAVSPRGRPTQGQNGLARDQSARVGPRGPPSPPEWDGGGEGRGPPAAAPVGGRLREDRGAPAASVARSPAPGHPACVPGGLAQ